MPEVPVDIFDDVSDHLGELGVLGGLECLAERHGQLSLVVEHLLKVRDVPLGVGRVAGETLHGRSDQINVK